MEGKDNKANKNLQISSLEQIDEKNELYENINEEEEKMDPDSKIAELQQKIISLEKLNKDLHSKNQGLTKNNNLNSSILLRMSLVGPRRKLRASQRNFSNVNDDSIKLAEIMKEKDDLQQMNEKMLDLLTDKELENEDLMQKLENYKLETKIENDKNLEKIQSLEEKISILENSKGDAYDFDDIINEYNNYKERLKTQLNEYTKDLENLKERMEMKDINIQKLNEEIQRLEIENLQLINQSEKKDKMAENEILEYEQLKSENEKIKREMQFLDEKLKLTEKNREKDNKSHEDEIIEFKKNIENEQNEFKMFRESKNKEIDLLKKEITKNNRDISIYSKKIDTFEKILGDEKEKNINLQDKLEKK